MDNSVSLVQTYGLFSKQVLAKMGQWPFYCVECANAQNTNASLYAPYLHDAFYLYSIALSNLINKTGRVDPNDYRNGTLMAPNSASNFHGQSGDVIIGMDGARRTIYQLMAYPNNLTSMSKSDMVAYARFLVDNGVVGRNN